MLSRVNALMDFASACPRKMAARLSTLVVQRVENDSRRKFSRQQRISSSKSIRQIFDRAHIRLKIGPIRVLIAGNIFNHPRICTVAGKRVVKRAVDRNRCKRQLREWFRLNQQQFPAVDMCLTIRKYPFETSQIESALRSLQHSLNEIPSEPRA